MAALFLALLLGLGVGAGLSFAVPRGVFDDDRQRADLLEDQGSSLEKALAFGDGDDPELRAGAALAGALLVADHAGTAAEMKHADALVRTAPGWVRIAPEALYARALLRRGGAEDPTLDDDLEKRADERLKNPWWLLARASRAFDAGRRDDAFAFAQKAALGDDAPLQAQVVLARLSALRGDVADARAIAERAERRAPDHAPSRLVGIIAAVVDDVRDDSPEHRAVKLKKIKQRAGPRKDGPPKPGEVHRDGDDNDALRTWRTAQEDGALERLDHIDERDQPMTALLLEALADGRGDEEFALAMRKRAASTRPALAAMQAELSLFMGDAGAADEALQAALEKDPRDPALLLDQARLHALQATLSEDEIRKRATSAVHSVSVDGIALPFGRIAFDWSVPGVPLAFLPDPFVIPEGAFADAMRATSGDKLVKKLDALVLVHKGESALVRGDIPGAVEAAQQAREKTPGDPEVLLLDARIRQRQGDPKAAKEALNAAVEAAPEDPHILLAAARLWYDNGDFIPARKTTARLRALGLKSPSALALEAMTEARSGNAKDAQAALVEAQTIGADDVEILRASVLLLRDGKDLDATKKAATKLLHVDKLRATDPILRAWEADAAAREGDTTHAQNVLDDVIASHPSLGDAYLFRGALESDKAAATALFTKALALAPGSAVAAEAARRRAALGGPPAPPPPKLPKKRPR